MCPDFLSFFYYILYRIIIIIFGIKRGYFYSFSVNFPNELLVFYLGMSFHYCRKLVVTLTGKVVSRGNGIHVLADNLYSFAISFRDKYGFFQRIFGIFRKIT